jgi:L-fuconolactonase
VTEADWHCWKYEDFVPFLEVVFEEFSPDRLMFGSDWPICLLAASANY